MHEGNPAAGGPSARHLVYQTVSSGSAGLECRVEIGNPIADVVNAGPAPGQEFSNRTVRLERGQQLHFRVAHWKRQDGGAIDGFGRMGHQAQDVPVKSQSGFQVGDGDADMGNAGEIGQKVPPYGLERRPASRGNRPK